MKDITQKLVNLFKKGYCTPQIAKIAKKLKEPSTTLHYNIKKLEKDAIKTYKAVFDYNKIDEGFCSFVQVKLSPGEYGEPEKVGKQFAKYDEVESVDVVTGDYELIIKIRSKDIDDYYAFVKHSIKQYGFSNVISLTSLKQLKKEFVLL